MNEDEDDVIEMKVKDLHDLLRYGLSEPSTHKGNKIA